MQGLLAADTNAYVEVLRGTAQGSRLRALFSRERTRLVVLAPVIAELLQGARTPREQRLLVATCYEAVPPARRVSPTDDEWLDTGRALAHLAASGHDPAELRQRGFYLDVHVAVVCRKRGITLVTADRDHARIQPYVGHRVEPLPG